MKIKKRIIFIVFSMILIAAAIGFFKPTVFLTVGDDTEIVYCYHLENEESRDVEIDAATQEEILEYLSTCKKYRTLYPANQPALGQEEYYYLLIWSEGKFTALHLRENAYASIGDAPYWFHTVNGKQVSSDIKNILRSTVEAANALQGSSMAA